MNNIIIIILLLFLICILFNKITKCHFTFKFIKTYDGKYIYIFNNKILLSTLNKTGFISNFMLYTQNKFFWFTINKILFKFTINKTENLIKPSMSSNNILIHNCDEIQKNNVKWIKLNFKNNNIFAVCENNNWFLSYKNTDANELTLTQNKNDAILFAYE